MKDKSTETKFAYIFDHILYGAICGFDVYKFLPLVAPIAYYEQSVLRVIFCMVLTSVVGISFTYGNNRTAKGTLVDILSGMGLYVALTVGVYTPRVLEILFGLLVCLLLLDLH